MATPVDDEQPQSSGLFSNTVLDALNENGDSDYQDTDSDSDVVECADEEELRTTLGISNESSQLSSTTSAASLLNVLRAPKQSDLIRKRKLLASAILENVRKPDLVLLLLLNQRV